MLRRESRTYVNKKPTEMTVMWFPRAIVNDAPELETGESIQVVSMIEGTGRSIDRTVNRIRSRYIKQSEIDVLGGDETTIVFQHLHATMAADEPVEVVVNVKMAEGTVISFETNEEGI